MDLRDLWKMEDKFVKNLIAIHYKQAEADFTLSFRVARRFSKSVASQINFVMSFSARHLSLNRLLRDAFRKVDGTGGTNDAAEVTTDTLGADNAWLTRGAVEDDGLMAAVVA